ncbi:MAG: ImmA/IrrE family metallo-endopeptidase [Dehalococcoidia bacterium]
MTLRRGFKTQANEIAREIRYELGLTPTDPLDPWALSEFLEIPFLPMSELSGVARSAVHYFTVVDTSVFSAVTVFDGSHRLIVYNDAHVPGRQASDMSHELSHAILLHPPMPAIDQTGCRDWNQEAEEEAEWLSGVLLVPEEAAMLVVQKGLSTTVAAGLFGVTPKLMTSRINRTGARKRVERARKYYILR